MIYPYIDSIMGIVAIIMHIILMIAFNYEMIFLIIFRNHIERNISFLGLPPRVDIFLRLICDISFLLDLIRICDGTIHMSANMEGPHFSHL